MKELLLMNAKYTRKADATVVRILDGLSTAERNENRGSYYGSLAGLAVHVLGAPLYFHTLFRSAGSGATSKLSATEGMRMPKGDALTDAQWEELKAGSAVADKATVDFVGAIDEEDLFLPVEIPWYRGDPASVPLYYLLNTFFVHGAHHRGQISQILDRMGIDNDYSGMDPAFLE